MCMAIYRNVQNPYPKISCPRTEQHQMKHIHTTTVTMISFFLLFSSSSTSCTFSNSSCSKEVARHLQVCVPISVPPKVGILLADPSLIYLTSLVPVCCIQETQNRMGEEPHRTVRYMQVEQRRRVACASLAFERGSMCCRHSHSQSCRPCLAKPPEGFG